MLQHLNMTMGSSHVQRLFSDRRELISRVETCATLKEYLDNGGVPTKGCLYQGRRNVRMVAAVDIGPVLDKHPDDFRVAFPRGAGERRETGFVQDIDINVLFQQFIDPYLIPCFRSIMNTHPIVGTC